MALAPSTLGSGAAWRNPAKKNRQVLEAWRLGSIGWFLLRAPIDFLRQWPEKAVKEEEKRTRHVGQNLRWRGLYRICRSAATNAQKR
jgi:hypothetical protein